ncbi:hypothetical protein EJ04DRAFT_30986 [Polyplosphaeria fusca]|uniref:Uncharacterized protein n=1 Tax=Polyplosphaeria fusca TaxID=682080 RepID=A0A9P4UZZ3_9PLEO|nr:hypothetical protein EJ04DRAFT_30986 [Polyplosphaeria fusca]
MTSSSQQSQDSSPPTSRSLPLPRPPLAETPLPSSPPTQTLIPSHPSARLSSSPASTPRVVESPVIRTRSLRPEMAFSMQQGMSPGADFFESDSTDDDDDDEGWEDGNGTRDFSEVEGLGLGLDIHDPTTISSDRAQRMQEPLDALPPFHQTSTHDSEMGTADEGEGEAERGRKSWPQHAKKMSLRRMPKSARLVDHHSISAGTPRESSTSQSSGPKNPNMRPFPGCCRGIRRVT